MEAENKYLDSAIGTLIGGAVGDALGYPVEFMSYKNILNQYGKPGITRYELIKGVAEISDDTQMTLYTANGLLLEGEPIDNIRGAYLEWYNTQCGFKAKENSKCWISHDERLYSRRAPGCTCMSALKRIKQGFVAQNNSKGCGGIMRVAPIGIYGMKKFIAFDKTAHLACEAARLTHKHPLGYLPAGLFAVTIQLILEYKQSHIEEKVLTHRQLKHIFDTALHTIITLCKCAPQVIYDCAEYADELALKTQQAICLAESEIDDVDAIQQLGEGWVGDETWYIAVYCSLKYIDSFEDAVVASINHSGDSDSTGAVTGNIMGAILGYNAIPKYYIEQLELRDVIEKIAKQL